jgi:hypothetical protein
VIATVIAAVIAAVIAVARDFLLDVKVPCNLLTLGNSVSSFAQSGKAQAQPCLGVAVLKRVVHVCGEAGFAKDCTIPRTNLFDF